MVVNKYIVVYSLDAYENKYPGMDDWDREPDGFFILYETDGTKPTRYVGDDYAEPEDKSLARSLEWVVREFNLISPTINSA